MATIRISGPLSDGRAPRIVDQQIRLVLGLALDAVIRRVVPLEPYDRGHLQQSTTSKIEAAPPVSWTGTVTSPLIYAGVQNGPADNPTAEFGRRPGARQPPSQAIELWARRKLGLDAKEAKRAAFVIARAISRRGLKALRFFERGLAAAMGDVRAIFERLPGAIVEVLNR